MSAIANIIAFDGAATPVTHTLVPVSIGREADGSVVAVHKESLIGVPDYAQIRLTTRLKRLPTGVFRVSSRISVPVMESVSGQNSSGYTAPPKVAYEDTHEEIGYFHERSTAAGRRLVRQLGLNIGGSIATSVAPVTSGIVPELFDLLIMPT